MPPGGEGEMGMRSEEKDAAAQLAVCCSNLPLQDRPASPVIQKSAVCDDVVK